MLGVDSTHALNINALKQGGVSAVGRYVHTNRAGSWKEVSAAEVQAYHQAGIGTFFFWETTATRSLEGYAAGQADGQAMAAAMRSYGAPNGCTGIWTVDTDVPGYGAVAEYDRGFSDAMHANGYKSAPYSEASVIDGSVAAGRSTTGMQTNAAGWDWPRRVSPHASIHQHLPTNFDGTSVDPDEIIDGNAGLIWWPGQQPPPPPVVDHWKDPEFHKQLSMGMHDPDVAVLKVIMTRAGYGGWFDTSSPAKAQEFGSGLKAAVIDLQRKHDAHNLTPLWHSTDGVVGDRTWYFACDVAHIETVKDMAA